MEKWLCSRVLTHLSVKQCFNPFVVGFFSPGVSASLGTHLSHCPNHSFSICDLACSARFVLHGEKTHCWVAHGSIHASTFPLPGLQTGPIVKLVIFMQIRPFHFLTTKANDHIYKSQGKPSFIVFTQAWPEYNS